MLVHQLIFRVQKGDIDVGGDDDDYFSNVVDDGDDDKHKNISNMYMNLHTIKNIHSYNHHSHHNHHGSNKCLK